MRVMRQPVLYRHVILLFALLAGFSATAQKLGDINRDDYVDLSDAVLILNHVQHVATLTTNQLALPLADVDTNGTVNIVDFQRIVDIILGRRPIQNFDLSLLSSDTDEDGLLFLDEFAAGTNPYLGDTDGDGLNDEVNLHSNGAVILAQPPVELNRTSFGGGASGIVLAKPPVEMIRSTFGLGSGTLLAQPPLELLRPTFGAGASGVLLAKPPLEMVRNGSATSSGVLLARPPLELLGNGQPAGALLAQPPVQITRE